MGFIREVGFLGNDYIRFGRGMTSNWYSSKLHRQSGLGITMRKIHQRALACEDHCCDSSGAEALQAICRLHQACIILGVTKAEQGVSGFALEKGRAGNARHPRLLQ